MMAALSVQSFRPALPDGETGVPTPGTADPAARGVRGNGQKTHHTEGN